MCVLCVYVCVCVRVLNAIMNEESGEPKGSKHIRRCRLAVKAKTTAPRGYFFIRSIKRVTAPDTFMQTHIYREKSIVQMHTDTHAQ